MQVWFPGSDASSSDCVRKLSSQETYRASVVVPVACSPRSEEKVVRSTCHRICNAAPGWERKRRFIRRSRKSTENVAEIMEKAIFIFSPRHPRARNSEPVRVTYSLCGSTIKGNAIYWLRMAT